MAMHKVKKLVKGAKKAFVPKPAPKAAKSAAKKTGSPYKKK